MNAKDIPVFINSRDRLNSLVLQIKWLENAGMKNIFVLDNASTYPPLLEYFNKCPHTILRLRKNYGYLALWESGIFSQFSHEYYFYTDPDILPSKDCPGDFAEYFLEVLSRNPNFEKIGFGLRIDDLPQGYSLRKKVIEHEAQFWQTSVSPGLYNASIDTTFALYRPGCIGGHWLRSLRTGKPYLAHHLPWYEDSVNPSEENLYYRKHAILGQINWTGL